MGKKSDQIKIDIHLKGELVDLYHEEEGIVASGLNELQVNDIRCQIVEKDLDGFYIMWNEKKLSINTNGDFSELPVGLYDHVQRCMLRIFNAVRSRV